MVDYLEGKKSERITFDSNLYPLLQGRGWDVSKIEKVVLVPADPWEGAPGNISITVCIHLLNEAKVIVVDSNIDYNLSRQDGLDKFAINYLIPFYLVGCGDELTFANIKFCCFVNSLPIQVVHDWYLRSNYSDVSIESQAEYHEAQWPESYLELWSFIFEKAKGMAVPFEEEIKGPFGKFLAKSRLEWLKKEVQYYSQCHKEEDIGIDFH